MAKKMIPCRVCGKLFEPCGYCQSHSDVFRWRNFACSLECANKYIAEAITYRNNKKTSCNVEKKDNIVNSEIETFDNKKINSNFEKNQPVFELDTTEDFASIENIDDIFIKEIDNEQNKDLEIKSTYKRRKRNKKSE